MRQQVTKEEFDAFIAAYPSKLNKSVATAGEPPYLAYFNSERIVATIVLNEVSYPNEDGSTNPNEYFIHE
jgi:hypothetical protein